MYAVTLNEHPQLKVVCRFAHSSNRSLPSNERESRISKLDEMMWQNYERSWNCNGSPEEQQMKYLVQVLRPLFGASHLSPQVRMQNGDRRYGNRMQIDGMLIDTDDNSNL